MKQHFLYTDSGGINPIRFDVAPEFLVIDLFCGAGGTTTGFERAIINGRKIAKVIACVNHDPIAIKSHWKNHPEVIHFEEDIRTLDLVPLTALVEAYHVLYPKSKIILWASLECTNFSKAKGGQPRDADSRTLADHLERYIRALKPDYIQIENVVEFMSWGPLDANGKPLSKRSGSDWLRWRREICGFGYYDDWRELNSADFGAYTSRNRLFGCFAKHNLPISWPKPTHSKKTEPTGLFDKPLRKWMPVKDVLDFDDEGQSIFSRKKPLSDKTLERIYAGLVKYVAGGKNNFIMKWNSMSSNGKHYPPSTDDPCPVITTQNRLGMCFIAKYYGNGNNINSIEEPAGTLTTKDRLTKVQPVWIDREFKTGGNSSINEPVGSLLTVPKTNIVKTKPWIMKTGFNNVGSDIEKPSPVIDASRHHHYIINPSHGGHSTSVENPCPVIIARQDKAPLYLTDVECLSDVQVYLDKFLTPSDLDVIEKLASGDLSEKEISIRLKILEFMWLYDIADIKMRMLKVSELKVIQGFGNDYILEGNQTEQKKFIGNSVVPHVVKSWCEAMIKN